MSDASEVFYYADSTNNRQGPVPGNEIVRLIGEGTVRTDTLIWSASLVDWRQAGQVAQFGHLFARYTPPPVPPPAYPTNATQSGAQTVPTPGHRPSLHVSGSPQFVGISGRSPAPAGHLTANFTVWGLFWRSLLAGLGSLFVIPAPWVKTTYYRYLGVSTVLPDGRRFTFSGQPGDIWLVFVGIAILGTYGRFIPFFGFLLSFGSLALTVLVFRWFCAHLGTEDGTTKLTFEGGIWSYIGWMLVLILSILSIIGWAWVAKAMIRWLCRNVKGTLAFDFTGTGAGILWRSLVVVLACMFIIPIPWMMRWYAAWVVSQIEVSPGQG